MDKSEHKVLVPIETQLGKPIEKVYDGVNVQLPLSPPLCPAGCDDSIRDSKMPSPYLQDAVQHGQQLLQRAHREGQREERRVVCVAESQQRKDLPAPSHLQVRASEIQRGSQLLEREGKDQHE